MHKLGRLVQLMRYRFLLFAGLFPYILGQTIAFHAHGEVFSLYYFSIGFMGMLLVLIGVETFNEYFDSKIGTDRVFQIESKKIPDYVFKIGVLAFGLAFIIALYLTIFKAWAIILFAFLGFLIAGFYVVPPIKWAYRGLGEFVIFLAYGPLMTTGSYYLQTGKLKLFPAIVSLIPGLLIMSLCLINEIPDYLQDKLVGKRNIVVRYGKKKAVLFYQIIVISCFIILAIGTISKIFPNLAILIFLTFPLAYRGIQIARKYYDSPKEFIPAIRLTVFLYTIATSLLAIVYLPR